MKAMKGKKAPYSVASARRNAHHNVHGFASARRRCIFDIHSVESARRSAHHNVHCVASARRRWILDIHSVASARGSLIERGAGGEGRGRGAAKKSRRKIKKAERGKRVYREGHPLAGQAHASGRHAKRSRVGFDWKVDCEPPPPIGGSRLMWVDRISRKEIRLHPGDVLP